MATLELSFPGHAGVDLSVRRFDIVESLSAPFEATLVATSSDPDLDFDLVLGRSARCRIDRGPLGSHVWSGICAFIEQTDTDPDGLTHYTVRVVPKLWLLSQRRGHRVYQDLSAPGIARKLLHEWGIEATIRLDESRFPTFEYRAQHDESDLAFLSRILEDAGISYWFEERQEGDGTASHLVLGDAPERGELRAGGAIPFIAEPGTSAIPHLTEMRAGIEVRPGSVDIGDFDFQKPLYQPSYRAGGGGSRDGALEHGVYAPGVAIDDRDGNALAARTLDALREGRRAVSFSTNVVDLSPGSVISLEGAPRPDLGASARLCVAHTSLEGDVLGSWTINVTTYPTDAPVKPAHKTRRPRVEGLQSAVVVGPEGQEIHTDEFGRVRLRFHWDREGQRDADRTPWVRVAEGWAGIGFGTLAVPRVGQEVLVSFFEGNPDQPVVVGRAYDASSPPPIALPGAAATSIWRSQSTPAGGGYHEISFDDRLRREQILVRSERDLEKIVVRDEVEQIGADRTTNVGKNLGTTIGGEDSVVAAGRVIATASGSTRQEITAGRISLTTGSATIQLDGPDITVTSSAGISIKAGGTVSIQGQPYVHLNPPDVATGGAPAATPPATHLVWFKLASEGMPLAGARVHVEHEDGTSSETQKTDANGLVRLPVDKPGDYHLKVGAAPPAAGETAKAPIPVGKTSAQPAKNARPTEHEVPIKIEILSPKHGTVFHTHTSPEMPTLSLETRVLVQGEPVEVGSVRWAFHVSGKYRVRDSAGSGYSLQEYKLPAGDAQTKPGETLRYKLDPAQIVGGDLEVKAAFHGGAALGDLTAKKKVHGCKVLGKSAPRAMVEAFIAEHGKHFAWVYLRMFCHESAHTLEQFATGSGGGNTPGYPLYGPPSGVGIVQRDPTNGEWSWPKNRITRPNNFFPRIFWDWEKNVLEGINSFHNDYVERGRRDLDALRAKHPHLPMYSDGVLMRAAIRRYNGGIEFGASADGRHYVVSPTFTNNPGYVNDVLDDPHIDAHKYPVPHDARATVWPK